MRHKFEARLSNERLRQLLKDLNLTIRGETSTDLIMLCCFHKNTDSPSFNISKSPPHLYRCWNSSCDVRGDLFNLLLRLGYSTSEARSIIIEGTPKDDFIALIEDLLKQQETNVNEDWLNIDVSGFQDEDKVAGYPGLRYLKSRGVEDRSYKFFGMGYSDQKKMLVIPILDELDRPVGVVGRSIQHRRYEYSKGFDRNHTVWNLNNARRTGCKYVILTEGVLDSVYIWQAGFESVGAIFGSSISIHQLRLIANHFQEIIIFSDNDEAGYALRDSLLGSKCGLIISSVQYPNEHIKDPEGLTRDEIKNMIENRKTNIELALEGLINSK